MEGHSSFQGRYTECLIDVEARHVGARVEGGVALNRAAAGCCEGDFVLNALGLFPPWEGEDVDAGASEKLHAGHLHPEFMGQVLRAASLALLVLMAQDDGAKSRALRFPERKEGFLGPVVAPVSGVDVRVSVRGGEVNYDTLRKLE